MGGVEAGPRSLCVNMTLFKSSIPQGRNPEVRESRAGEVGSAQDGEPYLPWTLPFGAHLASHNPTLGAAGIPFFQNRYFPTWILNCIK